MMKWARQLLASASVPRLNRAYVSPLDSTLNLLSITASP